MPEAPLRPEPFTPRTSPAALEDLRARLRATRWPDAPEDAGWSLGTDPAYLRELVAYWADEFDWPAREAALARLPRFRVPLGGLGIHFVHARAAAPAGPVLPLVLSHGWPDSFWRYSKVAAIPPAQHARRVEVPSGFSRFPGDLVRPPRAWMERTANTVRVTDPARGGHFAPFEEPELYAEELRAFFRPYRTAAAG
ncbi:epoxide hydrolase N-terminal domain-containing protein [Streptomyces sp. NPDC056987]|uniref:epoxide hydrolase N-terminal domain-containing protein n=1 Tax=Streptomyces sp. NPDC056987 TaxID=3345988 RepID=UPI00362B2BC2